MDKLDHYSILGISRSANKDMIRQAYKVKALELHPDKNPDGEDIFKLVSNAYQILTDPSKRSAYDSELLRREYRSGMSTRPPFSKPSRSPGAASSSSPHNAGSPRKPRFPTEEELFKDIYEQYKKSAYTARGNARGCGFHTSGMSAEGSFAEWFKKKQEELRCAEEITKAKAEYAKNLEREEQKRAEEWREMQRQREKEREEELAHARAKRVAEEEALRRAKADELNSLRAAAHQQKMEEFARVQKAQQVEMERHLRELAEQKQQLEEERRKMADERERAAQVVENHRSNRFVLQKQREEALLRAVREADEKLREAREQKTYHEAQQKLKELERLNEEKLRREEEERQREEYEKEEAMRKKFEEQDDLARRRASNDLNEQRKRVIGLMMEERRHQMEDVAAMRRETDRIEAEMRAKLDALREAKKAGQPINLDEWKL
ncbi:unnamed protein product [Phytomonas sp. EM1]|nr:unnamed protein product [Phytomonas sp. EM1]|eukprot:CCW60844.1 unnamed protein product [Phytomonas sp. isolate EM1]